MKKICVVTGTRAEYGLLYWTCKAIQKEKKFRLQLISTGMHQSPEFGLTYKQIIKDGFRINKKVEMLLSSDSEIGIAKSIGLGVISFSEAFEELKPDLVLILGDRFEMLSVATAATVLKIPIAHCHGGETTEGVIDEPIRHAITKMSHIHFAATPEYRKRIIQLGENPKSVHVVGAFGLENIRKLKLLKKREFEESINFKLNKNNVLVTFHPVTLEKSTAKKQFTVLLKCLDSLKDTSIIFTKPNADVGGRIINELIDKYVAKNGDKSASYISLGQLRYLSALKHVDLIIGNSSSGLIEAPSFKIATVDIGDRQRGRLKAESVINCKPDASSIRKAIAQALSPRFIKQLRAVKNPYERGDASQKIIKILKSTDFDNILKKKFFDLN